MAHKPGCCIHGDRERARCDGDVRTWHANQIDHQWNRQDRPAATDQPKREACKNTRQGCVQIQEWFKHLRLERPARAL